MTTTSRSAPAAQRTMSPTGLFCAAIIIEGSFFNFLAEFNVVGFSLSAATSIMMALVAASILLAHRFLRRDLSGVTAPIVVLMALATVLMFGLSGPNEEGIHSLVVLAITYLMLNLGSFARHWDLTLARKVSVACVITTAVCAVEILLLGITGGRSIPAFLMIPLSWWLARDRQAGWRNWIGPYFIVGVVLISDSRTALAAGFALLISALPTRTIAQKARFAFGAVAILAMAWTAVHVYTPLRDHFFQGDVSLQVGGVSVNGNGRTQAWGLTWDSFLTSPIVGQGPGSSDRLIKRELPGRSLDHPHNDYLRLLHDYGVTGLVLWLVFLRRCFTRLRLTAQLGAPATQLRFSRAARMCLIALSILMTTDNVFIYSFIMGPLAVLVGAGMTRDKAQDANAVRTAETRR